MKDLKLPMGIKIYFHFKKILYYYYYSELLTQTS